MSVELVHSVPSINTKTRVIRLQMDCLLLRELPVWEIRALYKEIENVRDALSRILDRADGKDA